MKRVLAFVFIICNLFGSIQLEENIHESENHIFYIKPQQEYNWSESVIECNRLSMALVTLDTEKKVLRLQKVLKAEFLDKNKPIPKLYIGAFDTSNDDNRKFTWKVSGAPFTYTNWEKSEPNNYKNLNERCVHLGFHGSDHWNDINCSRKYGFICELSKMDYEFAKMSGSISRA